MLRDVTSLLYSLSFDLSHTLMYVSQPMSMLFNNLHFVFFQSAKFQSAIFQSCIVLQIQLSRHAQSKHKKELPVVDFWKYSV